MEKVTKETFGKWIEESRWLKVNEAGTSDGRMDTFLTPSGNLIAAFYDLKGDLSRVGMLGPAPQAPPGPGFLGGKGFPFIPKG